MTPPAETETPPPLLHRSPSPLPSNTIPLLIALSFRMLSHHYPPSHLFFFLILHHLFSFCLPPSAPGLSYSTVFCLRVGASHTKPIKLNFRRMTLFHSRYNHRAIVRERSVSMVRSAMASWFFFVFYGFLKHNSCASGTLHPNTESMRSQYSVRMPSLSIDGVCVWDNTHKSWFLESPLMTDVLSVQPHVL